MCVFLFGYCVRDRGVAIHKIEFVVGQFPEIILHRFVGTMDGGVKGRVVDVNPERFFGSGLNDGVAGKGEGVRIVES